MKYILILYICTMTSGTCPSSTVSGYQFDTHYDCVEAGYKLAYNNYKNLEDLEEFEKNYIEENKIVVKFECRDIRVNAI
tara:strand:+ start:455 stop:691 length:237 start_codon:yes stop_codon:yes gene_type:complete